MIKKLFSFKKDKGPVLSEAEGFTLIEILIVIAIIGIIVGLFLPNYNEFRMRARDQKRKADIKAIVEALELYKLNSNPPAYPTEFINKLDINPLETWTNQNITYMNQFPKDPLYESIPDDYFYRYVRTDALEYLLGACLEDNTDPEGRDSPDPIFDNTTCDSANWYYKTEP